MKKTFIVVLILFIASTSIAQEKNLYDHTADAEKKIAAAVKRAKEQRKFVLLMGGGNWCKYCIEFDKFTKADPKIDSVINAGFILYHLNISKENMNKKTFASLGFPQRFGFPVFIIMNEKGERIHTQNSEYLEDGKKSYDRNKVIEFLENWSPKSLMPETYKDS